MKITVNKALLTALVVLVSLSCQAQEWDFSTWHKVAVKGELTKKLSLSVEQQLRLQENSSAIDETFTEIGLGYDLPKGFAISGAYRLGWSPDDDGFYNNRHRYNIDLKYDRKIWKLQAKVRARFQHRPSNHLLNDRLEPNDSPAFARIKLSVNYRKLKKWTPGLEFETRNFSIFTIESHGNTHPRIFDRSFAVSLNCLSTSSFVNSLAMSSRA